MSIGSDGDRVRRQRELSNNKNEKGHYHVRNKPWYVFGFAEHQEKSTYGLGYKLTTTRKSDNSLLIKANATNNAKMKINGTELYVPLYTPSTEQQEITSKQNLSKIPTELQNVERSVFMKEVNTQNFWTFHFLTQDGIISVWIIVGFQQKERQDSQNLNNVSFSNFPEISAQCLFGTEKIPDAGTIIKYDNDNYSQDYAEINKA